MSAPSLRPYLIVLGVTLLGQGLLSWLLEATGNDRNQLPWRFANSDPRHAFIHVVWGVVILVLLLRGLDERGCICLALTFGVFYSALAVLGIAVHHPFGLRLDIGENVFHVLIGPITLALGLVAARAQRVPA